MAPTPLITNYDLSAAVGGPIKQDRLWFFGSTRRQGTAQLFDMFYNKNEGARERLDVRAGPVAPGDHRPRKPQLRAAPHRAGDAAQQVERLLGRAVHLQELRERQPAGAVLAGVESGGATSGRCRWDRSRGRRPSTTRCCLTWRSVCTAPTGAAERRPIPTPAISSGCRSSARLAARQTATSPD